MLEQQLMCACGRPLHYSNPELQAMVQSFADELGENMQVTVGGRTWLVQRHYIALHGLTAWELPALATVLGFEEVEHGIL